MVPISQASIGSLSPMHFVSLSLWFGSSHVWNWQIKIKKMRGQFNETFSELSVIYKCSYLSWSLKTIATLGNWTCKSFNKIKLALDKKISLNIIKRVCGLNPWVTLHVGGLIIYQHLIIIIIFSNPIRRHYISQLLYRDTLLLKLARNLETRFTTSFIKSVFNLFAMQIQLTARFICDRRSSPLIIIFSHLRESTIIPNVTMVREAVVHIS